MGASPRSERRWTIGAWIGVALVGPLALYAIVVSAVGWFEEALDQAAAGGSYWDAVVFSITLGLFPAAAAAIAGWLVPPKPRKLVDVLLFGSLAGVIGGVPALIWLAAASLF